jgi:hypothetical protein
MSNAVDVPTGSCKLVDARPKAWHDGVCVATAEVPHPDGAKGTSGGCLKRHVSVAEA